MSAWVTLRKLAADSAAREDRAIVNVRRRIWQLPLRAGRVVWSTFALRATVDTQLTLSLASVSEGWWTAGGSNSRPPRCEHGKNGHPNDSHDTASPSAMRSLVIRKTTRVCAWSRVGVH